MAGSLLAVGYADGKITLLDVNELEGSPLHAQLGAVPIKQLQWSCIEANARQDNGLFRDFEYKPEELGYRSHVMPGLGEVVKPQVRGFRTPTASSSKTATQAQLTERFAKQSTSELLLVLDARGGITLCLSDLFVVGKMDVQAALDSIGPTASEVAAAKLSHQLSQLNVLYRPSDSDEQQMLAIAVPHLRQQISVLNAVRPSAHRVIQLGAYIDEAAQSLKLFASDYDKKIAAHCDDFSSILDDEQRGRTAAEEYIRLLAFSERSTALQTHIDRGLTERYISSWRTLANEFFEKSFSLLLRNLVPALEMTTVHLGDIRQELCASEAQLGRLDPSTVDALLRGYTGAILQNYQYLQALREERDLFTHFISWLGQLHERVSGHDNAQQDRVPYTTERVYRFLTHRFAPGCSTLYQEFFALTSKRQKTESVPKFDAIFHLHWSSIADPEALSPSVGLVETMARLRTRAAEQLSACDVLSGHSGEQIKSLVSAQDAASFLQV
ncbi:hypothetical protein RI367_000134 [Sorochytrium milnesiophthora]